MRRGETASRLDSSPAWRLIKKGGTIEPFRASEEMEIHLSLVNLPLALSPFRNRKGFFS
jgi:hypothetical protein